MLAFLAPLALKLAPIGAWLKSHAALVFVVVLGLVILGSALFIYSRGHSAGQKEVEVRVERQHTETIREVRSDEQLAQKVADQIGGNLTNQIVDQREATDAALKEIHDELAKLPAPANGAVVVTVPASVLARSNELVDRANRAASAPQPAE